MKEALKQLQADESAFFVSKEKIDFDIDGKTWKGHAVLVGPRGELSTKKLKQDGVQFREGTCRRDGKDVRVDGIPTSQLKLADVTLKKLRLGCSIVGCEGELETGDADAAEIGARLDKLRAQIKKNDFLGDLEARSGELVKQAAEHASAAQKLLERGDVAGAQRVIEVGEKLLGEAIVGTLEDGPTRAEREAAGGAAPAALDAKATEARVQELVADLKDAAALKLPANDDVLKQAALKARDAEGALAKKDLARAETLADELEDLLTQVGEADDADDDDTPIAKLSDWKSFRKFVRASLKRLPPEGGPFFVSRKKVEFTLEGKPPYNGHALLVGKKARELVLALKKDNVTFKEGTARKDGDRKLFVGGISAVLFKEAVKTSVKLHLGRKLLADGELPADDESDGDDAAGKPAAASGTQGTMAPAMVRKVQDVADQLVKLRAAADALKKAKLSDEPYRSDFAKLTNELGAIAKSSDADKQKETKLRELKTRVIEKTLDAGVELLDPNDPKTGPLIEKQIKARFGVSFKFSAVDAKGKSKKVDSKKEGETLKSLYQTLTKAPVFPKDKLKKLKVILKPSSADSEGGVYYEDSKSAEVECKRPQDSLDYATQLASPDYFPDGVDPDCQPANNDPVKYFNWATLHEVAHGVDASKTFMQTHGSKDQYGGWTEYGNNVGPIATEVAKHFGDKLSGDDLKALEEYALALMKNKKPKKARSPAEQGKRDAVKDWVDGVRVDKNIWWDGQACKDLAIGDYVYQEAYDFGGGWWNRYKLAARKQGIHGYQFRAPGEWFAELYAAYYSGKLKPAHPFVPDLKSLEKK